MNNAPGDGNILVTNQRRGETDYVGGHVMLWIFRGLFDLARRHTRWVELACTLAPIERCQKGKLYPNGWPANYTKHTWHVCVCRLCEYQLQNQVMYRNCYSLTRIPGSIHTHQSWKYMRTYYFPYEHNPLGPDVNSTSIPRNFIRIMWKQHVASGKTFISNFFKHHLLLLILYDIFFSRISCYLLLKSIEYLMDWWTLINYAMHLRHSICAIQFLVLLYVSVNVLRKPMLNHSTFLTGLCSTVMNNLSQRHPYVMNTCYQYLFCTIRDRHS